MRRAAGVVVLAMVGAMAVPVVMAHPVAAAPSPTLTQTSSATSGPPGTAIDYQYTWDAADCGSASVDSLTIELYWQPGELIGSATADATCSGPVSGAVPNNAAIGASDTPSASLFDNTTGIPVANSGTSATTSFLVTPSPTPTPTLPPPPPPTPTPRPTPPPTNRPTPTPLQTGPSTPTAHPTPVPTPTPTPLPTPTPFVIGGGGGGSGGGTPQGGADCSAGIGRSPTPAELEADTAQVAGAGADPTTLEIQLLSSTEYYQDAGNNNLGFVTRLYDDVLRHDPTPIEVATGLPMLVDGADAGRMQLVEDVVLSQEARAIRVDQAFHALLKSYPDGADLALWVNRLTGPSLKGLSGNVMVEQIAASAKYYAHVGATSLGYITNLYLDLLNRSPTPGDMTDNAALLATMNAGRAPGAPPTVVAAATKARLTLAEQLVTGAEFRTDEVSSFFANYMHPTCKELLAQECTGGIATPTASELAAALTSLQSGTTEEGIIAGVLSSPQYYQNHGSTQTGLIDGVYQDLIGRAPTNAELSAARAAYTNDPVGHLAFAQAMVGSLGYQDLVVSLDYQQLLLRAPLLSETNAGQGILAGNRSLQTPDELLIESIASTPEYYLDTGATDSRFVVRTIGTLLMRAGQPTEESQLLGLPQPHDATWQAAVAQTLVDSTEYRTDYIRGVYEKFLTYSVCVVASDSGGNGGGNGPLARVPGGWFGLGIILGVLIIGIGGGAFFALERRRFARLYPNEVPGHRPE
jgi:hypothetical protein